MPRRSKVLEDSLLPQSSKVIQTTILTNRHGNGYVRVTRNSSGRSTCGMGAGLPLVPVAFEVAVEAGAPYA